MRVFLTDSLLKTTTNNTKEYASQKRVEEREMEGWRTAVGRAMLEDISRWLEIVLYMGVHSSSTADDWRHD